MNQCWFSVEFIDIYTSSQLYPVVKYLNITFGAFYCIFRKNKQDKMRTNMGATSVKYRYADSNDIRNEPTPTIYHTQATSQEKTMYGIRPPGVGYPTLIDAGSLENLSLAGSSPANLNKHYRYSPGGLL